MPIVVRELVVRASVDEANDINSCATPNENTTPDPSEDNSNTENLLSVCMEKVMENFELKKER